MHRYTLFLLLVAINILSYVDRHLLPAFASQISADLDLSRQQFGLLTGFAFVTVYALSGPLMGVLADRLNAAKVIACGILLWSVMTVFTGMAKSFLQIFSSYGTFSHHYSGHNPDYWRYCPQTMGQKFL